MEEDWEAFFKNDDYDNVEELASISTSASKRSSTSNNDNMNNKQ